jgi:HEAT repeat protein
MKRKAMSAAEFMAELNADPAYEEKRFAQEEAQAARGQAIAVATAPLRRELAVHGYSVTAVHELAQRYAPLPPSVVGMLLVWLPRMTDTGVQEEIVRVLAAAKDPFPGAVLVELFEATPVELLRWAIANTIAEARPTGIAEWVAQALLDKRYGKAREMLALATARLVDRERANVILQSLLDDLPLHVPLALGEVGDEHAARLLEERLKGAKGAQRKELERALRRIRKKRGPK